MKKKLPFLLLSLLFFICFVIFSYFVHKNLFTHFDFNITVKLQDNISRRFDTPFSIFSLVGSFEIAISILLIILVIFKKLKGVFVLFLFAFFHIFELFGKTFVVHHGPPFMFFRYDIPFLFPSSYVQPGSSYPSGHAARTIFISIVLGFLIAKSKLKNSHKNLIYVLILIFDFVMLISRVYLAEHWTSDIIGGGILGASFAIISLMFL